MSKHKELTVAYDRQLSHEAEHLTYQGRVSDILRTMTEQEIDSWWQKDAKAKTEAHYQKYSNANDEIGNREVRWKKNTNAKRVWCMSFAKDSSMSEDRRIQIHGRGRRRSESIVSLPKKISQLREETAGKALEMSDKAFFEVFQEVAKFYKFFEGTLFLEKLKKAKEKCL